MSQQLDLVIDSIAQSKQLLEMAASEDWDNFFEIDAKRQSALSQLHLNADDVADDELLELTERMLELIELNELLEAICQKERLNMLEQLQNLNKNRSAHKAYSQ